MARSEYVEFSLSVLLSSHDLAKHLAFYGTYHNTFWNQVIHIIFVPLILWGFLVLFAFYGDIYSTPLLDKLSLPITPATFVIAFYIGYYIYFGDYSVTLSYSVVLLGLLAHATSVAKHSTSPWSPFLWSQILGWGMQVIVGHKMIEGRSPALLDSLFDALIMAPLFTWYELFFYCGARQELKREVQILVNENIRKMNQSKKEKDGQYKASPQQQLPSGKKMKME